jgi:hypothetical protein
MIQGGLTNPRPPENFPATLGHPRQNRQEPPQVSENHRAHQTLLGTRQFQGYKNASGAQDPRGFSQGGGQVHNVSQPKPDGRHVKCAVSEDGKVRCVSFDPGGTRPDPHSAGSCNGLPNHGFTKIKPHQTGLLPKVVRSNSRKKGLNIFGFLRACKARSSNRFGFHTHLNFLLFRRTIGFRSFVRAHPGNPVRFYRHCSGAILAVIREAITLPRHGCLSANIESLDVILA